MSASSSNYNGKRHVARTRNMCNGAAGTHIFFGSAMGPLDLALGTVPTRAGGICIFLILLVQLQV
jgi:hypothetical protein